MVQRPPDSNDPTSEEQALEFDGTHTDQLADTYRLRVVIASESASGTVAFDDRGQAQWKWITELGPAPTDSSATFDQLKALENPALSVEGQVKPSATDRPPDPPRKVGYNPYEVGTVENPYEIGAVDKTKTRR